MPTKTSLSWFKTVTPIITPQTWMCDVIGSHDKNVKTDETMRFSQQFCVGLAVVDTRSSLWLLLSPFSFSSSLSVWKIAHLKTTFHIWKEKRIKVACIVNDPIMQWGMSCLNTDRPPNQNEPIKSLNGSLWSTGSFPDVKVSSGPDQGRLRGSLNRNWNPRKSSNNYYSTSGTRLSR